MGDWALEGGKWVRRAPSARAPQPGQKSGQDARSASAEMREVDLPHAVLPSQASSAAQRPRPPAPKSAPPPPRPAGKPQRTAQAKPPAREPPKRPAAAGSATGIAPPGTAAPAEPVQALAATATKVTISATVAETTVTASVARVQPPRPPPRARPKPPLALFEAVWTFERRHRDELTVVCGDQVRQVQQSVRVPEPGWIVGENLRTREIGLLPENYVRPLHGSVSTSSQPLKPRPQSVPPAAAAVGSPSARHSVPAATHANVVAPPPPPPPQPQPQPQPQATPAQSQYATSAALHEPLGLGAQAIAKQAGYATDVIAVRSACGTKLFATNFNVRFTGRSGRSQHVGSTIDVLIDGKARLTMMMDEGAKGKFRHGSFQASPEVLGGIQGLIGTPGPHSLRYEHRFSYNGEYRLSFAEAFVWVWDSSDGIIVSDVDGTITRSDVGGMVNSVLGAKFGWKKGHAHAGVIGLYNSLVEQSGAKILYLTARPLNLINETRSYLYELEQGPDGARRRLPSGPVVTDTTNLTSSFKREVVERTSHIFKIDMLKQLRGCFCAAGRDLRRFPVFLASFGNKDTDVKAYLAAGAPPVTVFVIDTSSTIQVAGEFRLRMDSYHDPRLLALILERMQLIKTGRLPDPNYAMSRE